MPEVEYEVVVRVYRNGRRIGPIVSVLGDDVAFALEGAATEVETTIQPLTESGDSR